MDRPSRIHPLPHIAEILALHEQAESGVETHLYLTDYRSLYVGLIRAIETDKPDDDLEHLPSYAHDQPADLYFMLDDFRRLVADDTVATVKELSRLLNVRYDRRPVSLYGGMTDLALVVERPEPRPWFGEVDRLAEKELWAAHDRELRGEADRMYRELRENLLGDRIWDLLEHGTRGFLATAEATFRSYRQDPTYDFSTVAVQYANGLPKVLQFYPVVAILRLNMATFTRFLDLPTSHAFLFGPRGTGKTTWLREQLPEALVVNLLDPAVHRDLVARPERLAELVAGNPGRDVVIDEVQRAAELLHVVHDLIERRAVPRFILTGSSARKLRRAGVDLLAGRAVLRTLHPFMAAELPAFDLARALEVGLVPLIVTASDPTDTVRGYAGLYLREEVQAEGLVRSIGGFARFLETISFSHGSVLNLSNVARESAVSRKTVEGYLEIAEDLLLAFRLPVFTRRAQRETAAHPKFYFFDAGIFRALRPRGPLDRPEEIDGAALEGLVAQHLRAWIAYGNTEFELSYWRTRSGVEVDFVLYGPDGFTAIEVKNSARVRTEDVRALKSFRDDYPEAVPILLYRGADRLRIDGIACVPVEEFLRELRPDRNLA